jgi:ubiquinone biosynthesis protein
VSDDDEQRASNRAGRTLASRVHGSSWIGASAGLADDIVGLEQQVGTAQRELAARAVSLAQPGMVDPARIARHAIAAGLSRAVRVTTSLPGAIASGQVVREPQAWMQSSAIEAFVDQLALGGAAAAEVARQIEGAGPLFPSALRSELARREIRPLDVEPQVVQSILDRTFGRRSAGGHVRLLDERPITGTPISSLYEAEIEVGAGSDRQVLARVRRPHVARDLDSDSRLAAGAATALTRIAPDAGGMGPLGFVQLTMRQNLEATDLRYEALDLAELGLLVEEFALDGLVVARPVPGLVNERALVLEHIDGVPLHRFVGPLDDPAPAVRAVTALTLEAALVHGVFWADPAPQHLVVLPDERVAMVGVGVLGRFTPELRLAGTRVIKAVLTGEHEAMIDGMRIAGALTPDVDTKALLADLQASPLLDPSAILFGGQSALVDALNTTVSIMLAHKLQPPVEVILMLRTVFALGQILTRLDPSGATGLTAALMPLLPRLPEILAAAEEQIHG